jgi:hypothetical protein
VFVLISYHLYENTADNSGKRNLLQKTNVVCFKKLGDVEEIAINVGNLEGALGRYALVCTPLPFANYKTEQ